MNHFNKDQLFVNDCTAYTLYSGQANRIYNRLDLAHAQNIVAAPFGVLPPDNIPGLTWPIIVKPIVNLYGMSRNFDIIPDRAAYNELLEDNTIAGQFWMPFISGRHYTVDALMYKGTIIFYYALESVANPERPGIFKYHVLRPDYVLPPTIQAALTRYCLADYTGPLNIEIIQPHKSHPSQPLQQPVIIEAHLRWNGDNHLWKIKRNKPVLAYILLTVNNKAADLAKLAKDDDPHYRPILTNYMREMIPATYHYVPVFIDTERITAGGISQLKDQIWEFAAANRGWPVVWDIIGGLHQAGAYTRICICIVKTAEDLAILETFKNEQRLY